MKYCPFCGVGLGEDMRFCPKCGKRFEQEQPNPHYTDNSSKAEESTSYSSPKEPAATLASAPASLPQQAPKKKTGKVVAIVLGAVAVLFCIYFFGGLRKRSFSEDSSAIEKLSNSVVMLNCYDDNGTLVSTGSGFVAFEDNTIITNFHVINNIYSIDIITATNETIPVTSVLAYEKDKDIAILTAAHSTGLPLLSFGTTDNLKKGDKVVAIGSPLGLMNSVSTGVFSGYIDDRGNQVLQFTAPISSGSSGGALFNDNGEVVGITFASFSDGQNLNLGVPAEEVSLLREIWQKAETNDPEAMYKIGRMFYEGTGIAQDYAKALRLFEKASSTGYASATNALGLMYYKGHGVTQNYRKAMDYYQKAADAGEPLAFNNIGVLYQYGNGVEMDPDTAFRYFMQAANAGDTLGMINVGQCYKQGEGCEQDYQKAMTWYKKAAAAGDGSGNLYIGLLYYYGRGVELDYQNARLEFLKAYEADNISAPFMLGILYEEGDGVEQDYSIAMEWYQKGADLGDFNAMQSIGRLYENGLGVEKNPYLAQEWYAKADATA